MKKLALALLVTTVVNGAQAEVKKAEPIPTSNKVEAKENLEKYKRIVHDESMANREGKKFTINAAILGVHFGTASAGVEFGYHQNENTVISLQALQLVGDEYDEEEDGTSYAFDGDGKGNAFNLSVKHFTGNSFYIKPGLYYRKQTIINGYTSSWSSATDKWTVIDRDTADITDMGISFAIGNQWQWENFTLGCDWIGLSRSVSVIEKNGKLNSEELNSGNALNFYMGYTF